MISDVGQNIMKIRYITPKSLPCYQDHNFPITQGVFILSIFTVIAFIESDYFRAVKYSWGPKTERDKTKDILEKYINLLLNNFNKDSTNELPVDDELNLKLWINLSKIVENKMYDNCYCPECNTIYNPIQIDSTEISNSLGTTINNYNKIACPKNHVMHVIFTSHISL